VAQMKVINNMTFTLIIAVKNGASTLQRCIDSVLAQSYSSIELIIIDADSDDGTKELLRLNDHNIAYWESKPDRGIAHAWNKALKHAKGEWLCFLGADDYFWDSAVIDNVHYFIQSHEDLPSVIYGKVNVVDAEDAVLGTYGDEWSVAQKHILDSMSLPHQGVFHHRSLFLQHGEFDEIYKVGPDYEFLLRELIDGDAILIPSLIVTGMQQGGLSSDPHFALHALKDIRNAVNKHNTGGVSLNWYVIYIRALIRRGIEIVLGDNAARIITSFYRKIKTRQ